MSPARRRSQVEKGVIVAFAAAQLVLAPLATDLYPFSTMPMFSERPTARTSIAIFDPAGAPLDPALFHLQDNDFANPSPRHGLRPPATHVTPGQLVGEATLRAAVQAGLERHGLAHPYVDVHQRIVGPRTEGARATVGIVAEARGRVWSRSPRR